MPILRKHLFLSLLFLLSLLGACRPAPAETAPTPEADTVLTAAAQTASARLTEIARPTETATPAPSDTPAPVTPTGTPTVTPTLALLPTITPTGGAPGGDQAEYVADISIPDGTDLSPGEQFTKTWRLRNAGTSVWTTNYSLAFIGGAQMDGPNAVSLTQSVNPGETVDISVNLVAPLETGTHRGFWEMRDASQQLFPNSVFVEIDVLDGTPPAQGTEPASGEAQVTDVDLSIDDASPDECPHTFTLTATFTLSDPATVRYQLEASSDTPGFEFDLPGPASDQLDAGEHSVQYTLELSNTVEGVAQFHVLSPNDLHSNEVNFSLTCGP